MMGWSRAFSRMGLDQVQRGELRFLPQAYFNSLVEKGPWAVGGVADYWDGNLAPKLSELDLWVC